MISSSPLVTLPVIAGLTGFGLWLAQVNRVCRKLGATMVILMLGLVLTNFTGWKPDASAVAWVNGPLTSLAIAELLLAVELRTVLPASRRLLQPFITSVFATLMAVLLLGWLMSPWLGHSWIPLTGLFSATFTGGSLNFVSVARSLQISPSLLAIATAADHVAFTAWFLASLVIGSDPNQHSSRKSSAFDSAIVSADPATSLPSARSLILSFLWGAATLLLTEGLVIGLRLLGVALPSILVLTTVALVIAQLPAAQSRLGCYWLGLLLIQPFFAVIGLSTSFAGLFGDGLPVLLYAGFVVLVQALVVLLARRCWRWPLVETLVASQAAVGGPSTALALAGSLGRSNLVLPSVAIGLLGYLLGTYLGLSVSALLSRLLA